MKNLVKQRLGKKPKTADQITDEDINSLYEARQLGCSTQQSIINTLWLNNTLHFGIRFGGSQHHDLCWGDVKLGFDTDIGT